MSNYFVGKCRAGLREELDAGVDESIRQCDVAIQDHEEWKLGWILTRYEADPEWDWKMKYNDLLIKTNKFEKHVWVAIKKRNWVLTEPFRKKYREVADEAMECMEEGVSKGYMPEDEYIKSANIYKEALEELEKVSGTIKMFYGVIPLSAEQVLAWWGVGAWDRGIRAR